MGAATTAGRCWRACAAALCLGAVGCFAADYLAYVPCATSESCAEAGMKGCVRLPDREDAGFCTLACDGDDACPEGQDGDATPRCATVGEAAVCVLECAADGPGCPTGFVCTPVAALGAGGPAAVCFPGAGS